MFSIAYMSHQGCRSRFSHLSRAARLFHGPVHGATESACGIFRRKRIIFFHLIHEGDDLMEQHQQKQEERTIADDPKAREMLRQAFEKTARWPKNFKGFTADLTVNVNGKETGGSVMVKGPREVSVQLGDAEVQKWAQEQLGMTAVHRGARTFE